MGATARPDARAPHCKRGVLFIFVFYFGNFVSRRIDCSPTATVPKPIGTSTVGSRMPSRAFFDLREEKTAQCHCSIFVQNPTGLAIILRGFGVPSQLSTSKSSFHANSYYIDSFWAGFEVEGHLNHIEPVFIFSLFKGHGAFTATP